MNVAHPVPGPLDGIPVVQSHLLDDGDLVGSFIRNAFAARAAVIDIDAERVPDDVLARFVEQRLVRRAVVSREPEALDIGERLTALGVMVDSVSAAASANADLGVTSAVAALATTGTIVQDSGVAGGRTASLLPPVHLCVLPASRIVASTADVLRTLGDRRSLPSNIVLITGPSRSGDIEQIMALGVHGPIAVEIALLRGA